jgi:hypothetical protein
MIKAFKGEKMKFLQVIMFLTLSMMVHGAKVTWTAEGKVRISKTEHPIEGCHMDKMFTLSIDKNETLLILDRNISQSCF